MFSTLRNSMTLTFATLAIVPVLVLTIVLSQLGLSTLESEGIEAQSEVARRASSEISSVIAGRLSQLELFTRVRELSTLDQAEQRAALDSLLIFDEGYKELVLLNAAGQELVRTSKSDVFTADDLTSRAGQPEFVTAVETQQPYVSELWYEAQTNEPLLTLSVPGVDLVTGQVDMVLIAVFRFRIVWSLLSDAELASERSDLYVTNTSGQLVAHPNRALVLRGDKLDLPDTDGRATGLSGDDVILAREELSFGGQQFYVVAERDTSDVLALANTALQVIVAITAVALLAIIAAVLYVVRRVVSPIEKLSENARLISEGNRDVQLDVHGAKEINEMANAFNVMAQSVQHREEELVELNQSLEQRVAERTVDLKRARDEALAAQRIAQENSRLKSEFLSMMSHELRTPMNAIEGFTSIILKRMAGVEYNEKAERYLNKIQSNSARLLGLINDFLDLSRIESGRLELAYMPMSPSEMATQWHNNLSSLAEQKGLNFEVVVDPELPEIMYGDEESLSKVAINLAGNAIKFTETGSVTVSLLRRGDQMELQVRDTGVGIPPHAREFIFEEFRQVDQTSKRKYGGTGLGLAIVQKLVRAMEGTVTVQSEVGVGSIFTVLVPIQLEKQFA